MTDQTSNSHCRHGIRFPHECMECKNEVTNKEMRMHTIIAQALLPFVRGSQNASSIAYAVLDAIEEATPPQEPAHQSPEPARKPYGAQLWSIVRSAMGTVQYLYERELTPSERDAFIDAHASEYAEKIAKLCSPGQPRPVPTKIWLCANKTTTLYFATEDSAKNFSSSFGASSGFEVFPVPVIAPAGPRPVPTSERVPTKADADCNGAVWWWNTSDACWAYVPWNANLNLKYWTFWQPTGLTRPEGTSERVEP